MRNLKTITVRFGVVLLLAVLGGTALAAEEQQEQQPPSKNFNDYRAIYERNMFSRNRRPPEPSRIPTRRRTTQRRTLAIYVLRGVAAQKNERVAFIEEQISGDTSKASVGDEVLDGTITEIRPNGVTFKKDGQTRHINIGGEFGQSQTTVEVAVSDEDNESSAGSPEQTPAAQPAESSGSSGGGSEEDILKRLMEKRQSQMGQ